MDVIEFRPERDQYAFTFGGVAPVRKVQPGTMLRLWTDDAFCGNLRDPADMPSAKLTMPFVNPQTGPSTSRAPNRGTPSSCTWSIWSPLATGEPRPPSRSSAG